MATVDKTVRVLTSEQRVVIRDIGWDGYETLLQLVGDGHVRLACDGKDVELMSPSRDHDLYARLIGRIVDTVTEELRIPCQGSRTTTWRQRVKEKGLEADDCFYLSSLDRIRGKRGNLDLTVDPPPDLAVEVEISRSALDRMGLYALLGVPEVWRFDGDQLTIELLQPDGQYAVAPVSPSLPMLPPDEIVRWVLLAEDMDDHSAWNALFRGWVRAELMPG